MAEQNKIYDTVILGGGPAGYTAALYAARAGLDTLLLEKFSAGGQMTQTAQIDNYPGFEEGIDGFSLGLKMQSGAERFGARTVQAEVLSVALNQNPKCVKTDAGEFLTRTVIIATGAEHKHLGVQQEEELTGRGVSYCAACDGMFFRGKTVAVVGGGNSAAADALLLSRVCKRVYLIHRRDTLRAEKIYRERLEQTDNVIFKWNRTVTGLLHDTVLTGVTLHSTDGAETESLSCDGLFISIGRAPCSALFRGQTALDGGGYIIADESTRTNLPGVFVAGDVRTKAVRQIVTAAADGAAAAHYAEEYLIG